MEIRHSMHGTVREVCTGPGTKGPLAVQVLHEACHGHMVSGFVTDCNPYCTVATTVQYSWSSAAAYP